MVETILLWSVRDHPFVVCHFVILLKLILMVLDALRDRVHLVLFCCCELCFDHVHLVPHGYLYLANDQILELGEAGHP